MMKRGFAERWVDFLPRPGKRSGAYMSGSVYDVHPFMLMNFNSDFGSVRTLAHEFGARHAFAPRQERAALSDLRLRDFRRRAGVDDQRSAAAAPYAREREERRRALVLPWNDLERIRGTFFRQTMFAEFELRLMSWWTVGKR